MLTINNHGITISEPGVYTYTEIADGGVSEPQLGVVALIGEAAEGDAWSAEVNGLSDVSFTPDQFGAIVQKYGSGPLVDAAKIAFNPSDDDDIKGGAQQVILMKTNQSVKASLALASSYGTLYAVKAGAPGNNTNLTISIASNQATITINRADLGLTETGVVGNNGVITLECNGVGVTAATVTISATTLTTTITGGSTGTLNITLSQYATVQDLVNYINTVPGYVATVVSTAQAQYPPSALDRVTASSILTSPLTIKRDAYDVAQFFASSQLVTFTPGTAGYSGLPAAVTKTYFASGALGGTSQANIQTCLDALSASDTLNFLATLFAQDATADITAGNTDSSSTYTISAIHAAVRSHVLQNSTMLGRKERQAACAITSDTFSDCTNAAGTLACDRVKLFFQICQFQGNTALQFFQPWALAVADIGMKAAAPVGLSNTNKLVNCSGFKIRNSTGAAFFDPSTDATTATAASLSFVEKAPGGGIQFHLDNTTYGQTKDAWYHARSSVIYAGDIAVKTIRQNLAAYVGKRNSDISPGAVTNKFTGILDDLRTAGILVGDKASGGKGYKNVSIQYIGNYIKPIATLVLVENVEWVLPDLSIARATF